MKPEFTLLEKSLRSKDRTLVIFNYACRYLPVWNRRALSIISRHSYLQLREFTPAQSKHKRDLAKRRKRPLKKVQVFAEARGGPECRECCEVKSKALTHRGSLQAVATTLLQELGGVSFRLSLLHCCRSGATTRAAGAGPGHKECDVFCIMLSQPFGKNVQTTWSPLPYTLQAGESAQGICHKLSNDMLKQCKWCLRDGY